MENLNIRLIATGGTFDKVYDPIAGQLTFSETHLNGIFQQARVNSSYLIQQAFLVDSLEMTSEQRQEVLAISKNCKENKVLIVHGTDTLIDSAKKLLDLHLKKTIVLVGAMVPYTLDDSDATFNIAYAYASCQHLPIGVYIAMNGQIFDPLDCKKDRVKGLFKTLQS